MEDVHEFDFVYDVYEDGSGAGARDGRFFVYTSEGTLIEMKNHRLARAYAGLEALFGDLPLVEDFGVVPVEVALDGRPAIAIYLFVAHYDHYMRLGWSRGTGRDALADTMGVTVGTLRKYFSRVTRRFKEKRVGGELNYFQVW